MRLAQSVIRSRQQHRDGARTRQCADARLIDVFQVVRGQRLEPRGQLRGSHVAELTRVQVNRQLQSLSSAQIPLSLLRRECDRLAECIHRVGEPRGGNRLEPRAAYLVDEPWSVLCKLPRQRMQAQIRRSEEHTSE